MKLTSRSPCKINLVLNSLGLRPDGYHELETLFYPIPFFDELTIESSDPGFHLTCSNPALPVDSSNLVYKAANSFFQETGFPKAVRIHLEKRLPLSAGLGAGSANAAITLRLLNQAFGNPLDAETLGRLASALGSDVNFFLQDQPAIGRGRGEKIEPLPHFQAMRGKGIFLFHPGFGVSTPWAFKQLTDFPESRNGRAGRAEEVARRFMEGDWDAGCNSLYNALEGPVLRKFPILRLYQNFFRKHGARAALMSGSGSTTFALFDSMAEAREILPLFTQTFGTAGWDFEIKGQTFSVGIFPTSVTFPSMRQSRMKGGAGTVGSVFYHCISRVVDRRFIFGGNEKEQFIHWMAAYAEFCGVRVLTYCVMSNHFHILLEVPERPQLLPDDEELLRRYGLVHGEGAVKQLRLEMVLWPEVQRREWREGLYGQMWDVSRYMKVVKQRFTQWYNRRMNRKGTLWEERFKSLLVEGSRESLAKVGAYIDLNPIRAKLAEDPKDYRWCGYAAAVAGKRLAKEGISALIHVTERSAIGEAGTITEALATYRMWVFGQGMVEGKEAPDGMEIRPGIDPDKVRAVLAQRGNLTWAEFVRCRVRYFTDGAVLGSREWVNEVFQHHRSRFGPKRVDGARKVRHLDPPSLFALRDLQKSLVEDPQRFGSD